MTQYNILFLRLQKKQSIEVPLTLIRTGMWPLKAPHVISSLQSQQRDVNYVTSRRRVDFERRNYLFIN